MEYTVDHALRFLAYLHVELGSAEPNLIRQLWDRTYQDSERNPVKAVWQLYVHKLPELMFRGLEISPLEEERAAELGARMEIKGINLKETRDFPLERLVDVNLPSSN